MKGTIYDLLINQGFVLFPIGDDNLISAERAFFAQRAIHWIRSKAKDPKFDLQPYLVALTYYKLGMADLKFDEDELLYRYRGISLEGVDGEFSQDADRTPGSYHRPDQPPPKAEQPSDGPESP
tara:strand:- start:168 stop:536 length:369 start_codon:yes stop_codon:yes gene_type:complete